MNHTLNVKVAMETGEGPAIILNNFYYWIQKNIANDKHFYDGRYWTYNSYKALTTLFPYWTERQIRSRINTLEKHGFLIKGNYNKKGYDNTNWYSLTDKAFKFLASDYIVNTPDKNVRPSDKDVQPIPNINTNINTNINNSASDDAHLIFFEKAWKKYPNKRNKGRISNSKKKEIYKLGDEFLRAISRYIEDVESQRQNGFKDLKYKVGSTFFNGGYIDYLDETYKEIIETDSSKEQQPIKRESMKKEGHYGSKSSPTGTKAESKAESLKKQLGLS